MKMREYKLVAFFVLMLLCCSGSTYGLTFDKTVKTGLGEKAEWTVMVYMDGDNNLESNAIDDFFEMSDVGSTEKVNIVVQFDRIGGYDSRYGDWVTTKRYYIIQGMTPDGDNAVEDIGEANMGDPQTVIDFVNWGMSNYPADHYCLIFWDHGSGWKTPQSHGRKYVCEDETDGDELETYEFGDALRVITNNGVNKLDLTGFDACLMGMMEIAYEIKDYTHYMTASEDTEPVAGWDYYNTLWDLVNNSSEITGRELGELFVSYYSGYHITLSTLDLNQVEYLTTALDNLVISIQLKKYRDEIQDAIDNVKAYTSDSADLYNFIELIQANIHDTNVDDKAQMVLNEINNVVASEKHDIYNENSHGIAIYLPYYNYDQNYDSLRFTQGSQWDDFLRWWFYGNPGSNPPTKPVISGVKEGSVGTKYSYSFFSTDPDNDDLYYYILWGDYSDEEQIGPVVSGETIERSHTWETDGGYIIKAKAVDVHGAMSEWSYFRVSMPREKIVNQLLINKFIGLLKQMFPSFF